MSTASSSSERIHPPPANRTAAGARAAPAHRQKQDVAPYIFCVVVIYGCITMYLHHSFPHNSQNNPVVASFSKEMARGKHKGPSKLAGLNCDAWGGPPEKEAQEMVYWQDIPEDSGHISPLHRNHPLNRKEQNGRDSIEYLTFEPDEGGWNNIRMSMETVLGLAFAMGRTLVLPPEKELYLLTAGNKSERKHFGFHHFFHMEQIAQEHPGLDVITMQDFLEREAGKFRNRETGEISNPPGNRTKWDGAPRKDIKQFFLWLRNVTYMTIWDPNDCLVAFPASPKHEDVQELLAIEKVLQENPPKWEDYVGKPVPVDAPTIERLKENWAERKKLCIYDEQMQASPYIHFPTDHDLQARFLVHFYAFIFFASWQQDLWMKRFIRDHVRYVDEIQCAAARVVAAVREHVRNRPGLENATLGEFDSFHIRRGDFQYKPTRLPAEELLKMAQKKISPGSTIYISTDERNKTFFDPMKEVYDIVFLDDFIDAIKGMNTNYYGMIDQLVATRGRIFYGCWFSTFTGYILRIRGYHMDRKKTPGYEQGILPHSWFYAMPDRFDHMQVYYPVKKMFYAREFPTSWRLLDTVTGAP